MKERADSEKVSPTAYATGYFWYRHGLSHAGLVIPEGRGVDRAFRLLIKTVKLVSGISIDAMMLARHVGIDALLSRHIRAGHVSQVVELGAGLSPRGWRFAQVHGGALDYLETDLPHIATLKRDLLERSHLATPMHRVTAVDVLKDAGPGSLAALAATLDRTRGLAIITEGLMSYLDPPAAQAAWQRIAATLKGFAHGVYLSDAYVQSERYGLGGTVFRGAIERFVKGRVHVHFQASEDAQARLRAAGFASVTLHQPKDIPETRDYGETAGGNRVRVLEALT